MQIFLDDTTYENLVQRLLDPGVCPFSGRIEREQVIEALGLTGDIWPAGSRPDAEDEDGLILGDFDGARFALEGEGPSAILTVELDGRRKTTQLGDLPLDTLVAMLVGELKREAMNSPA